VTLSERALAFLGGDSACGSHYCGASVCACYATLIAEFAAVRAEALEEAALACRTTPIDVTQDDTPEDAAAAARMDVADAIRALKEREP
jgi:hypothetical protein